MSDKWRCSKCSCLVDSDKNRCSFCSNPKPVLENNGIPVMSEEDKLTQKLHNIIETLKPLQKTKLYRYFEDNVL